MNKFLKRILFGLIIYAIPFLTSFFVWDIETNAPTISMAWFNALMAFTFAVGISIAACIYFRKVRKDTVCDGWKTGITWYVELLVLDYIFLVTLFGMSIGEYYPMFLTYINVIAISAAIGYILKK